MKTVTTIALLTALLASVGCTTLEVKETPEFTTPTGVARIAAGQAVAILTFAATETDLEADAVECIREHVTAAHPEVGIIKADEFRRTVFPYRIPDDEAERAKYLDLLMGQPILRDRMATRKFRYLILLHGKTAMTPKEGFSISGVGPGGGAYIFFGRWDRKTDLVVSILDVSESRSVTKLHAEAAGSPWIFSSQIIFTIGAAAFTETHACTGIGQAIAKFLSGETLEQIKKSTKEILEKGN
jgi:hypothetical protein